MATFPRTSIFFHSILLAVPFYFFSTMFVRMLGPVGVTCHGQRTSGMLTAQLTLHARQVDCIALVTIVLFFTFSFAFSVDRRRTISTFRRGVSTLTLTTRIVPKRVVRVASAMLGVFTMLATFFNVCLNFRRTVGNVVLGLLDQVVSAGGVGSHILALTVYTFVIVALAV